MSHPSAEICMCSSVIYLLNFYSLKCGKLYWEDACNLTKNIYVHCLINYKDSNKSPCKPVKLDINKS